MRSWAQIDMLKPMPLLRFASLYVHVLIKPLELKFRYVNGRLISDNQRRVSSWKGGV